MAKVLKFFYFLFATDTWVDKIFGEIFDFLAFRITSQIVNLAKFNEFVDLRIYLRMYFSFGDRL